MEESGGGGGGGEVKRQSNNSLESRDRGPKGNDDSATRRLPTQMRGLYVKRLRKEGAKQCRGDESVVHGQGGSRAARERSSGSVKMRVAFCEFECRGDVGRGAFLGRVLGGVR